MPYYVHGGNIYTPASKPTYLQMRMYACVCMRVHLCARMCARVHEQALANDEIPIFSQSINISST